ncbi:MAG: septal ring lytic transglycosylase RlpA family protein [Candidatus Levybacteria bacterium]|nr:septal ring lytic transglycosylase RlpA family protein [Candidatus Levybacteria bacterium]
MKKFKAIALLAVGLLFSSGGGAYATSNDSGDSIRIIKTYQAKVSWYKHGKKTANGERFNSNNLTVAHKTIPFGTIIRFTNLDTGHSIIARVNDRGPYIKGREFDVSMRSAEFLGIKNIGVSQVKVEIFR